MKTQTAKILALMLAFAAPYAAACTQMPPHAGLVLDNDRNRDAALNLQEWQQAQVGAYFVNFRLGDAADFKRLDKDADGLLQPQELADWVRYRREPCADWEEMTRRMMQEQGE